MPSAADAPKSHLSRFGSIIGGSIGNLVEWYDWYAYSIFSLYFAAAFFPGNNQTAQLLNTAGIFAIGFLMRPFGGWLMGAYADRKGRKSALTLSVLMMCGGSLLIAVVPGYAQIGIAAPLILVIARMVQGFSIGGEYGTVATYLGEMAPKKLRGFYSSFMYITATIGQLIALTLLILMQRCFLSPAQLGSWGWRIPFAVGAALGLTAFYLRRNLLETNSFSQETTAVQTRGSIKELLKYKRESFIVIGFTLGGTVAYYTFTNYMQKFLVNTAGFSKNDSTLITFIVLIVFMLAQPFAGLLGDRYSRKNIMIIYSILSLLTTIPILALITATHQFWTATALITAALLIQTLNTSISGIIKAELFPASIRSLGVSFPYAVTVALFGGTAEYIALWFKNMGHEPYFYWYITICILVTLTASFMMGDTSKHSKLDDNSHRA